VIRPLLIKEVKDTLRDPRILVPFILSALIMPVLAFVITVPMRSAVQEAVQMTQNIGVLNLDNGYYSRLLLEWLSRKGYTITYLEKGGNNIYSEASAKGLKLILVIPNSFSSSIENKKPLNVTLIAIVDEISFTSGIQTGRLLGSLKSFYLELLANNSGINPQLLQNPVESVPQTYISSKKLFLPADPVSLFGLVMAALFIPIIVMSIAMVVMQMSATSMAVENEEKTLETLLTMPVPARDILTAKLLGMFLVSLLGSLFEMIGIGLYFLIVLTSFPTEPQITAQQAAPPYSPAAIDLLPSGSLVLLVPSLLISLFFAAALGVVIGALSKDVRIANTILGPLSMLIFLPGYFVIFAPSQMLGPVVKAILYIFPLTQPTILAKDIVASVPPAQTPLYLVLSIILTMLLVYLTSHILSLETLSRIQYAVEQVTAKLRKKRTSV